MLSTLFASTGTYMILINEWMVNHSTDAYLQAVYAGKIVGKLTLVQMFS